jgi:hypothetical protein
MKYNSLQLTAGGKKEHRRELDFYPTPKECTIALMNFLNLPKSKILEPACGNGSMADVIKSYGHEVFASDISEVYGYGLGGIDYLVTKFEGYDAVITNPPFAASSRFIQKALTESPIVAMLLKSQYWHSKSRYNLFMDNIPSYVLPLTWRPNFAQYKGKAPTMEVFWTVWNEGDRLTKYIPLLKPTTIKKDNEKTI